MGACCSKCKGRKSRCYKRKRYAVNSNADDIKSPDQEAVTLRQVDGLSAEGIVVEKTEEVRQCRRTSSGSSSSSSCSGRSKKERKKSIDRNSSDSGSGDDDSQPRNMSVVSDDAPLLGMHIEAIRHFLRRHPEISKQRLSTSDINRSIVKPETHGTKRPFIAKYLGKKSKSGVPLVAPATVFISHAWRYEFVSVVVDVMEQHAKKRPRSYFWFDLFTNDQNAISSRDFDWFSNTFRNSIRSIGQVLLVLSPWNDPMPIRRAIAVATREKSGQLNSTTLPTQLKSNQPIYFR